MNSNQKNSKVGLELGYTNQNRILPLLKYDRLACTQHCEIGIYMYSCAMDWNRTSRVRIRVYKSKSNPSTKYDRLAYTAVRVRYPYLAMEGTKR